MDEGRSKDAWDHTAYLCAVLANCNRREGRAAYQPHDFHPHEAGKRRAAEVRLNPSQSVEYLARMYAGRG